MNRNLINGKQLIIDGIRIIQTRLIYYLFEDQILYEMRIQWKSVQMILKQNLFLNPKVSLSYTYLKDGMTKCSENLLKFNPV